MRHFDKDAREILAEITAHCRTEEEYRDFIWLMREPVKPKRSSSGWPYKAPIWERPVANPARGRAVFEVVK